MTSVLDEILSAPRERTGTAGPFPVRGDDAAPLARAQAAVDKARRDVDSAKSSAPDPDDDPLTQAAQQRLADAETALADLLDSCPTFLVHVREVSPERYSELVAEHPPTAAHRKQAKQQGQTVSFNPDTFPTAFIAEAITKLTIGDREQTDITPTQVDDLWRKLSEPDREILFSAAYLLRRTPTLVGSMGKD